MQRPTLSQARAVLQRYFGYADFRPPQLPAVESVLGGRDAVIVLPTGGGKSICFQVPALCLDRLTVVISPLISLMADQVQALERHGIAATFLNSTLPPDESVARVERIRRREVRLLYVAPERLAVGSTAKLLAEAGVDLLAIDEAHCVSEWGQDFRPSYLRLPAIRREIGDPQTVALTATATPGVRRDIARLLELRNPDVIVGGFDRPNLTFRVRPIGNDAERNQVLVNELRSCADPAVVYAATRRQVEQVARILSSGRVNAVAYHAGLPAERRARAQDAWMRGQAQVIVATNAFGMGIDKPDVRLVAHYLHSGSLEDYYQEAGRAGRDGAPSNCLLLFHPGDRGVHDRMQENGNVAGDILRSAWQFLAANSGGRRPIPLDPQLIASKLGKGIDVGTMEKALAVLEERGLLSAVTRPDHAKVRLLASPLRMECERASLGPDARAILLHVTESGSSASDWCDLRADAKTPLHRFEAALAELESRQLLFVDRVHPRAVVEPSGRGRLEHAVHQLKRRREAERAKLISMVGYATSLTCRRRYILNYFGDRTSETADCCCDACAGDPTTFRT
jgi:ATP-dependent DNA helicase RecQ